MTRPDRSSRGPNVGRVLGALLLALVAARPVSGQQPDPQDPLAAAPAARPPVTATVQPRRLDFGVSLFDGYDLTSLNDGRPGSTADPLLQQDASFTGVNASLTYSQTGQDNSFGAAAGTGFRYYSVAPSLFPVSYYGGLNFSTKVSRHVRIRGSEVASVSPFYGFGSTLGGGPGVDPTLIVAPTLEQSVVRVNTVSSDSSAGLTWTLSPKASFNASYSLNYVTTAGDIYRSHGQAANGSFQYQKTRYMNVRLGYGYSRFALFQQAVPYFGAHNIDAGIGYRRPLSFSRRSIVGFNVGSTLFTEGTTRSFFLTGDASLSHQLSRRWSASLAYNRGVGRAAAVTSAYVNDSVYVAVTGLVTPKFGLSGNTGYTRGTTASGSANAYQSIYATARVGYTVSRFFPVYVEYVYYFYKFNVATGLLAGFPLNIDRHGLRAGVSYAVPLIGRRPTRR